MSLNFRTILTGFIAWRSRVTELVLWRVTRCHCGVFERVTLALNTKQKNDGTSCPEDGRSHESSRRSDQSTGCYFSEGNLNPLCR
jgi:hypothetical protein